MATVAVPCNPATLVTIFAKLFATYAEERLTRGKHAQSWEKTHLEKNLFPFELPHPHVSDIKSRIINSPILIPYTRLTIMLSTQWWSLLSFTWSLISVIIIYVTNMIQRTISIPIRPTATPRPAASSASLLQHLSHTFEYNVRSDLNHIYIR